MQNHQTHKNTRPIAPSEYSTAELIALLDKHFGDYTPRHANAISRRAMHQAATMARGIKAACRLAAEAYRNGNTPPDISDLIHLLEAALNPFSGKTFDGNGMWGKNGLLGKTAQQAAQQEVAA